MIWTERFLPNGEKERLPLPFLYAEMASVAVCGYGPLPTSETHRGREGWQRVWGTPERINGNSEKGPPYVSAGREGLTLAHGRGWLSLYLCSLDPDGIRCRMQGTPFPEETLEGFFRDWRRLPHSTRVIMTVIDRADWYDAHPGYRGIPVKQSKTVARRMGVRDDALVT